MQRRLIEVLQWPMGNSFRESQYQGVVNELPFNIPTFKHCVEILTVIC